MARRKSSEASGVNLDSLMDTLTNVVGILIIILILVQINVSQALKKIVSELPPASPEEVQQLKDDAAKQKEEHEKLKTEVDQLRKKAEESKTELVKLEPELQSLELTAKQTALPTLDLDTLRKQLEEKSKLMEQRKKEMAALLAEQQQLKAVLDTTPVVAPPPAKTVRIPNSRPLPEKAVLQRYLIAGGQIFYVDNEAAKKVLLTEFQSAKPRLEKEKVKDPKGGTKIIYDQTKVAQHFAQRKLSLRNLDIKVAVSKTSTRAAMQLVPRPNQGEPVQVASQVTSRFQNDLRRYKGSASVVWFTVGRDSFEAYLRARDICDLQGVPAGWEASNNPVYSETITEFEVNRLEEPKPADPNARVIAAPKKKLD